MITSLFEDGYLRGFAKVTRDLTARKLAENTQRQLQELVLALVREQVARSEADANVRLRDAFLRATAHELRTPVTAVFGSAQLLQRRLARGDVTPQRVKKPIQAIAGQSPRLERLTNLLLESTRLEHASLCFN